MKKANHIFLLTIFVCLTTAIFAQTNNTEKRVIEVMGSAETLITPNEFTFKIRLNERIEDKKKITIEVQEANLKSELANLGVDVNKDLTIFDLSSTYVSRKRTKDTLGSKDYRLKTKDLTKIERLQEIADRLNVGNLELVESTHSDLTTFRKETKMEAVKAAKAKAEYMLGAIGERVGKAVFVKEIEDKNSSGNFTIEGASGSNNSISFNRSADSQDTSTSVLTFSQIKLRFEVLARFEIE